MLKQKRCFETRGPVNPKKNYVVPRTQEIASLVERIKQGRYVVIFAPRQTGKTTFFRWALDKLTTEDDRFFPIQLNFEIFVDTNAERFYVAFREDVRAAVVAEFGRRQMEMDSRFSQFLQEFPIHDHWDLKPFFTELAQRLDHRNVAIIIDEFDGIPQGALRGFLHALRQIYLSAEANRCPHSVSIVGVRSITQLNYDRSIFPFNIQDEFNLPNFTLEGVRDLLEQYTDEVGQAFASAVVETLHHQTAGQPFLVNRMAQILTEEMAIPKRETVTMTHFSEAHRRILHERNVNISHLVTNIRRDRQFERILMQVCSREKGVRFNLHNDFISELATYGVLVRGSDGLCEIANPIYQYHILQAFQPLFNGLEDQYLPADSEDDFLDYLGPNGNIDMRGLLANFRDFIARAGYRILEVPETPQEFVGQYLLFAYLDQFVRMIRGFMYLEVRTGRGRMDLILLHQGEKYIVETKLWEGNRMYQAGKRQLVEYLKLEHVSEGYLVVFDHRAQPQAREEAVVVEGVRVVSYVIPVVQQRPSDAGM